MSVQGAGGSSAAAAAAAAAAARARAEAEARARAEAAARARAEAAAKAKAAAAARQAAQAAQKKAAEAAKQAAAAREANQHAQAQKSSAGKDLDSAKSRLDTINRSIDERGPRPGQLDQVKKLQSDVDAAQKKYDAASADAAKAQKAQDDADQAAKTTHQDALDTASKALNAEKAANTAATAAGTEQPFKEANEVKDVYDAGSLSAKDQEKLFGAKTPVTPEEAGKADAQRVQDAANRSPKEGAEELQRQLQQNDDPAYRAALVKNSGGAVDNILKGLNNPAVSQDDANATVKALAQAGDLAGPDGQKQISAAVGKSTTASLFNPGSLVGSQRVRDALKANASDPAVVKMAGGAAEALRQTGSYDAANAIDKLDPAFKNAAAGNAGEAQAQQAVQVQTVGDEKNALVKGGKDANTQNQQAVDQVFSLAGKDPKDLPPGVQVVKGTDPNRAELVAHDKDGNVTARTVAIRDGDSVTLQKTTYQNGQATLSSSTTNANGDFTNTQATWKEAPSANPSTRSIDDLKNSGDPNVQVQEQSVHHDGDKLVEHDYAQGKTGITDTTKTYYQQSKGDATHSGNGIKDDFEGKFDDGKPVDVVDTHTVSIPAGGTKGPDGKQAMPQISDSSTFSQDGLRLERDAGTQTFKGDYHPEDGKVPTQKDLQPVAALTDMDHDTGPVQWKLEENHGNTYDAQTFVEGHTDLSTVTHREAHGSTVTESVTGKVPSEDGKSTVDVSSNTSQTYAADGSLSTLHKDEKGPDGSHTVTDFNRTTKPTPNGLQIDEHVHTSTTDKDGKNYQVDRNTQSLLSGQGVQLQSSDETVTGPDGSTGRTRIDDTGTHTFIDGTEVNGQQAINGYGPDAQALVTQSGADTFKEAQTYLKSGGVNALKLLAVGKELPAPVEGDPTSLSRANNALNQKLVDTFGQEKVDTAFRVQGGALGATQALSGLAGAVSSTNTLIDGIRNVDIGKIAKGVIGDVTSGLAIKSGGTAFFNAVKGIAPEALDPAAKAANIASKTSTWLQKVPGVSEELATAAGDTAADASSFLGKFGGPVAVIGLATSGFQLYQAINSGNGYKIAEASVGTAGALGAIAVGAAIGSAEPGLGTLIGAGIGLATFGVQQLIGMFDHSDTDIAGVKI